MKKFIEEIEAYVTKRGSNAPVMVALTGKMRSGKTTLANRFRVKYMLDSHSPSAYKAVDVSSFGGAMKTAMKDIFYGSPIYDEGKKPRQAIIDFAQGCRKIDKDVWVRHTLRHILFTVRDTAVEYIIIDDLRQPNEYKALKDIGFKFIKIEADDSRRLERVKKLGDVGSEENLNDETERYIDTFDVDYVINNDGDSNDAYKEFERILKELKEGVTQ